MWRRRHRAERHCYLNLARKAARRGDHASASRWLKMADDHLRHDMRWEAWIGNAGPLEMQRTLATEAAEAQLETLRSQRAETKRSQDSRSAYWSLLDRLDRAGEEAARTRD